jgi:molecular chaperone GrpE (heat shock protein)
MKKSRGSMRDTQLTDEIVDEAEDIPAPSESVDGEAQADDQSTATETDDRLGELEREITLERDKYLRLAAEFDNFR